MVQHMGATLETEWFDEYESDVNHMLWPLRSPNINPADPLWEILTLIYLLAATVLLFCLHNLLNKPQDHMFHQTIRLVR